MQTLILKDTYVGSEPVFKGQVCDLPEQTLKVLSGMRKAVALISATKEQHQLIEARQKIDEANSEKLSATAGAI